MAAQNGSSPKIPSCTILMCHFIGKREGASWVSDVLPIPYTPESLFVCISYPKVERIRQAYGIIG